MLTPRRLSTSGVPTQDCSCRVTSGKVLRKGKVMSHKSNRVRAAAAMGGAVAAIAVVAGVVFGGVASADTGQVPPCPVPVPTITPTLPLPTEPADGGESEPGGGEEGASGAFLWEGCPEA